MSERLRLLTAAALVAAAIVCSIIPTDNTPTPAPQPKDELALRGMFVGSTAASDAITISAISEELAAEIEFDGLQPEPLLTTGVSFDELRARARSLRMRGESIGSRQPRARDAIAAYLDAKVGTSGGPVGPLARAAWVSAFREIARAAADATR